MNAVIVGMGLTHATNMTNWDKQIRKGYIQIDNINEGNGTIINLGQVETTTADGTKAGTSAGDSGGPLLITQDNNNYCVMAITRSGYVKDNTNVSIYENLKFEKNLDFVSAFEMIEAETEEYLTQEKESTNDDTCL